MQAVWSKCISRRKVLETLKAIGIGDGHAIPVKLETELPMPQPVYRRDGTLIGSLKMWILASSGRNRRHRVTVCCDKCSEWIPIGRYHQHWSRADHRKG